MSTPTTSEDRAWLEDMRIGCTVPAVIDCALRYLDEVERLEARMAPLIEAAERMRSIMQELVDDGGGHYSGSAAAEDLAILEAALATTEGRADS